MKDFQPVIELLRIKPSDSIRNAFLADKSIHLDEFSYILREKLNIEVESKNVDILFHQLDPYSKGFITCTALENYLQYYEERRNQKSEELFNPIPMIYSGVRSQDTIFEWTLYSDTENSSDEVNEHYVSLSRDGLIGIWRKDLTKRFEKSVAVSNDGNVTPMATGLACIPRYKMIAVSTASGDIRFFSSSIYK
ncbi:uncharacterized protein [Parasteatoda tepidariorum]|uniref:uncharacterized protein n=1 Tax=Parasteatoda tepidariorum TaxID=114398 RepID=UPI0039BC23EA